MQTLTTSSTALRFDCSGAHRVGMAANFSLQQMPFEHLTQAEVMNPNEYSSTDHSSNDYPCSSDLSRGSEAACDVQLTRGQQHQIATDLSRLYQNSFKCSPTLPRVRIRVNIYIRKRVE